MRITRLPSYGTLKATVGGAVLAVNDIVSNINNIFSNFNNIICFSQSIFSTTSDIV